MYVAFYLEISKKEDNLGVPDIHGRANLFKEIVCDCVNWIQLIHKRDQERIHLNTVMDFRCMWATS